MKLHSRLTIHDSRLTKTFILCSFHQLNLNLTTFIEQTINTEFENKIQMFATKDDISVLNSRIEQTHSIIAQTKAEIIKWMFIFWVGQVMATFGFILLFLKK